MHWMDIHVLIYSPNRDSLLLRLLIYLWVLSTHTVHLHIDCVCNMQEITTASDSINGALADRKMEIVKLCGVHHLLKKVSCNIPLQNYYSSILAITKHLLHWVWLHGTCVDRCCTWSLSPFFIVAISVWASVSTKQVYGDGVLCSGSEVSEPHPLANQIHCSIHIL